MTVTNAVITVSSGLLLCHCCNSGLLLLSLLQDNDYYTIRIIILLYSESRLTSLSLGRAISKD